MLSQGTTDPDCPHEGGQRCGSSPSVSGVDSGQGWSQLSSMEFRSGQVGPPHPWVTVGLVSLSGSGTFRADEGGVLSIPMSVT